VGWRPEVKGLNLAVNTSYNHWRFEDVWLDRRSASSSHNRDEEEVVILSEARDLSCRLKDPSLRSG